MPATITDVCNIALSHIDRGRINSLEDNSEEGKQCRIHYDHVRKRLLTAYPWDFATIVEKLAERTETAPGWQYCYGYPAKCLLVKYVYDEEHARFKEMSPGEFEVMMFSSFTKVIATNVQEAYAEYTYDLTDPALFSEEFIGALGYMLAAELAMPLTGSANIQSNNLQQAQMALEAAKHRSVIEQYKKTQYPRKYANMRFM